MSNLEEQVKQLVGTFTGTNASSLNMSSSLKDLGLSSANMGSLSKVIEQVAGVAISDSNLSKFKILGDIVSFLQKSNVKEMNLSNLTSIIGALSGSGSLKDKLANAAKEQGTKMVADGLKKLFG